MRRDEDAWRRCLPTSIGWAHRYPHVGCPREGEVRWDLFGYLSDLRSGGQTPARADRQTPTRAPDQVPERPGEQAGERTPSPGWRVPEQVPGQVPDTWAVPRARVYEFLARFEERREQHRQAWSAVDGRARGPDRGPAEVHGGHEGTLGSSVGGAVWTCPTGRDEWTDVGVVTAEPSRMWTEESGDPIEDLRKFGEAMRERWDQPWDGR